MPSKNRWNSLCHLVIKRVNRKHPLFGDNFSLQRYVPFWGISHCHFWLPEKSVSIASSFWPLETPATCSPKQNRISRSFENTQTCGPPTCKHHNHGLATLALEQRCDITKHHDYMTGGYIYNVYIYICIHIYIDIYYLYIPIQIHKKKIYKAIKHPHLQLF